MLETEIVEGDHANKDNRERHHLAIKTILFNGHFYFLYFSSVLCKVGGFVFIQN